MGRAIDDGNYVGSLAMDLLKAFDSMSHGLHLANLRAYGLSLQACKLIKSYLTNWQQRVKINDKRSSWQLIKRGVPQGSIAGPILFNVHFNDLFSISLLMYVIHIIMLMIIICHTVTKIYQLLNTL